MKKSLLLLFLPYLLLAFSCEKASGTTETGNPPVLETTLAEFTDSGESPAKTVVESALPIPSGLKYAWLQEYDSTEALAKRVAPPENHFRVPAESGSFAEWLRFLPLKPGKPNVLLYNGAEKGNQSAHHVIINMDVGNRDLQQCADAVMRLRAEYLYSANRFDDIHFNFVSGENCDWNRWRGGQRPKINGSKTTWKSGYTPDDGHPNFRKYMDMVYTYAGTASLTHELNPVNDPEKIEAGDVFILGGSPGHAVIVLDVAQHPSTGKKVFLLAQSYMPAQEMHILVNPSDPDLSPWYSTGFGNELFTPEWVFEKDHLKRFPNP